MSNKIESQPALVISRRKFLRATGIVNAGVMIAPFLEQGFGLVGAQEIAHKEYPIDAGYEEIVDAQETVKQNEARVSQKMRNNLGNNEPLTFEFTPEKDHEVYTAYKTVYEVDVQKQNRDERIKELTYTANRRNAIRYLTSEAIGFVGLLWSMIKSTDRKSEKPSKVVII